MFHPNEMPIDLGVIVCPAHAYFAHPPNQRSVGIAFYASPSGVALLDVLLA